MGRKNKTNSKPSSSDSSRPARPAITDSTASTMTMSRADEVFLADVESCEELVVELERLTGRLDEVRDYGSYAATCSNKIYQGYQRIAATNIIKVKILDHLLDDVEVLTKRRKELRDRNNKLNNEHQVDSKKLISLKGLASQLSARADEADRVSSAEIRSEQEQRLALSQGFSAGIGKISESLEALAVRRKAVVAENTRLKEQVNQFVEELKELPPQPDENALAANADELADDPALDELTSNKLMEIEDLTSRLHHLWLTECRLKTTVVQQSRQFEQFQQQLTTYSKAFHGRQSAIDSLQKEIQKVEDTKGGFVKRVSECVASAKTQMDMLQRARVDRDKYSKLAAACSSLLVTLRRDIEGMGGISS